MSRASMINRRTDRGSVAAQMAAAGEVRGLLYLGIPKWKD